ncbi:hypothetical protein Sgou_03130 [Streptomyces gougerotii]|uniref:Uncharacterized protein n=1 Tax=Streptomyces gougerotii TaxID=53448 RepID=A0A8H9HE74_9ACTN|nr:hypothetical protein Sgou_03130 [Streptomyces gougerotii]GGU59640.1 hypothetical protein GCM10010227_11280 [Streptomyces gougerotii]
MAPVRPGRDPGGTSVVTYRFTAGAVTTGTGPDGCSTEAAPAEERDGSGFAPGVPGGRGGARRAGHPPQHALPGHRRAGRGLGLRERSRAGRRRTAARARAPRALDALGPADGGTEAVLSAPDADVARFREASAPALARGRPEARPGPAAL